MVCLKKIFNGEIIFHFKKETEKMLLPQCYYQSVITRVTDLIQIIVKFRTKKISLCASLSSTKYLCDGHEILHIKYCVAMFSKGAD